MVKKTPEIAKIKLIYNESNHYYTDKTCRIITLKSLEEL